MCGAARSSIRVAPLAIAAAAVLADCGGAQATPDAHPDVRSDLQSVEQVDPRAAICATADAAGVASSPPFEVVQQIFDGNCVVCHSPGADVDLSPGVSWGNLVNRPPPATEACGGTLVIPGDAAMSYLYQKISLDQPCSGFRMPRTEFASDPLPDCVIALVANWIASGAPGPATDGGAD